jgi:uncharacterized secreted protein with C-terminal beta-propeller domain
MQTYYEKVLNRMRRPVLLVAVALVALLAASGMAVAVNSTDEGRDEGRAVKVAAPDGSPRTPVTPATTTAYRSVSITIPSGSGTKRIASSVTFNSNVRSAAVALNGFNLDYSTSDHHINVVEADLDIVQISGRTVFIAADTRYADQNFDDSYSGFVTAVVTATVE